MDFAAARARLVDQLRAEGIADEAVLAAIGRVPRERFIPPEQRDHAYENTPLPIGEGQTISQPFVVALMTSALRLHGGERALEIGTGSGYQAAVLAELGVQLITLERFPDLAERAAAVLAELGYRGVHVYHADGTMGWPTHAPYDAILVTAGGAQVPPALIEQLAEGGRLVMPVGGFSELELLLLRRRAGRIVAEQLGPVRFVPLIGQGGWHAGNGQH